MIELKEEIKQKLSEAVELWSDENLIGKPEILAVAFYTNLERCFIENITEINNTFKE